MNDLIKALYDNFYEPLKNEERCQEIEDCHRQLIEALEKPERKLVLHIIDNKDAIADELSLDSFIAGFWLAWRLSAEVRNYELGKECSLGFRFG